MLVAAAAGAWGVFAAIHYHRLGLTLAHYDARAHLVVARRIFDSLMPGWQQVGAVWLPLPHLLNALPVQIDYFYRTGFSGIAISIASMAIAAWAIAALIQRATGSTAGGAAAAALLMLNPDVLYLQSTPMTEPLLFGTTFLAIALIGEWSANCEPRTANREPRTANREPRTANCELPTTSGPPSRAASPARFGETAARRSSRAAGWACIAGVLTRYEAWPVIVAAIVLAFAVLLKRGWTFASAARAVRGLALWPMWAIAAFLVNGKITVGSWFVSSGFFVAENPAMGHPWLAWTQVWDGLVRLAGPVLPWLAVVSVVVLGVNFFLPPKGGSHEPENRATLPPNHLRQGYGGQEGGSHETDGGQEGGSYETEKGSLILALALIACAALPLYAYVKGHPLRIRYDVPLVAAAAALTGSAVALLPRRAQWIAGAAIVALTAWQRPPFDPRAPVVVESQREAPNKLGRRAVTAYLDAHWDGQPIMMSMGSLGHYMHDLSASGFRVRDFLHEGNGELWNYAVRHPRPFVEWIAIEERAEGGDALHWQATHDPNFLKGYTRVAEGGGVALYRRF
jgi:hypothetical protein